MNNVIKGTVPGTVSLKSKDLQFSTFKKTAGYTQMNKRTYTGKVRVAICSIITKLIFVYCQWTS